MTIIESANGSATFNIVISQPGKPAEYTYQWYVNGLEIPGATETIDVDLVIVAVGVSPNPIVPKSIEGIELGRKNTISVNDSMQSSIPTIFAGGDIVRGGATVILAMGDGRKAAAAMNEHLNK